MIESRKIKQIAIDVGFSLCGVTSASPMVSQLSHLMSYLVRGDNSAMVWLARDPKLRVDPSSLLEGARSVICCALSYGENGLGGKYDPNRAAFARGKDYHVVIMEMLKKMVEKIKEENPENKLKCCVDTSSILEKALAAKAGLGWIGKNTLLINEELGPWLLLGEIITDLEVEIDQPHNGSCGDCRKCVDACPTGALSDYLLNAGRCISYHTIENKGGIPKEFNGLIAEGKYGCDLCALACPYSNEDQLR